MRGGRYSGEGVYIYELCLTLEDDRAKINGHSKHNL
jgi:hypothetical protein